MYSGKLETNGHIISFVGFLLFHVIGETQSSFNVSAKQWENCFTLKEMYKRLT